MKKNIFALVMALLFISTAVIAGEAGKWIKAESKMMSSTMVNGGGGGGGTGGKITMPTVWFNYWGSAGAYNVQFYGQNIEPTYRAQIYVDGIKKGEIIPQRTTRTKNTDSSALIDLKSLTGQVAIYEPGLHHTEVRVYISQKTYYSYTLNNLDVPYFETGIYGISADQTTVYVKYYLQPIFITISVGESANVTIGDFSQSQLTVQTDQWGQYFVEIGVPMADYQSKMQNQQVLTSIEVQGHVREWQAYYW